MTPLWAAAITTELGKFRNHNCLVMTPFTGQHVVPMKWIFSIKTDGTCKARLVGRGDLMIPWVDFNPKEIYCGSIYCFFAISVLVVTTLIYLEIRTLRSAVTISGAVSISGNTIDKGVVSMCCESTIGKPILADSSGAVARLKSIPVVLLPPSWRVIMSTCCGVSKMASFGFWRFRICSSRYFMTANASLSWVSCSAIWQFFKGNIASWMVAGLSSPNLSV